MQSNPYNRTKPPTTFAVEGRLNLKGAAEFRGVRNHPDRAPTSEIRALGVDLIFETPQEAEAFASAAQVMAAQHHIAWERAGLIPTRESVEQVAPQ
ncbi:hypothetical protein [Streptosporangium sp. NPDC051022]|uniref:hypothetical protein n=1 Tax=Streptosporangium sp. NPDC051022 TaxID=3155752 RepID=UPI00341EDD0C